MNLKYKIGMCLVALSLLATAPACSPTPTPVVTSAPTDAPALASAPTPGAGLASTPTETPTVTPRPSTGLATEKQPDGSTIFFDFDNGYRVTFPAEWIVVPLNGADLATVLETVSQTNPDLPAATEDCLGGTEPETIRAVALYFKAEFISRGFVPNTGIIRVDDPLAAKIPMNYLLPNVVSDREKDGTVTSSEVRENADGLKIGVLEVETDCKSATNETVSLAQRVAVFQTSNTAVALAFSAQAEFSDQLMPIADAIIASIELLQ